MYDIDDVDFEIVKDLEKDVKPGELLYADFTIRYKEKNKFKTKDIRQGILSSPYESNWPVIDEKYVGVLRWFDKKQIQNITDISITEIKIRARTGFINKPGKYVHRPDNKPRRVVEDWEKTERLDNGSFV